MSKSFTPEQARCAFENLRKERGQCDERLVVDALICLKKGLFQIYTYDKGDPGDEHSSLFIHAPADHPQNDCHHDWSERFYSDADATDAEHLIQAAIPFSYDLNAAWTLLPEIASPRIDDSKHASEIACEIAAQWWEENG